MPAAEHGEGHHSGHHGGGIFRFGAAKNVPSETALTACGDQPKNKLVSFLDLKEDPRTTSDWAYETFTCSYHLNEGTLKISVQEATDETTALALFKAKRTLAGGTMPLEGPANLGLPAYETPPGSAVFQKDAIVLHVGATDLPATLGPSSTTRHALAQQLAATVLDLGPPTPAP